MGEVHLAQDTGPLDRKVALKFPSQEMRQDRIVRQRFLQEARSAAALDHPYICHIHEVGEHGDQSFISMEHGLEGKSSCSVAYPGGSLPVRRGRDQETPGAVGSRSSQDFRETLQRQDRSPDLLRARMAMGNAGKRLKIRFLLLGAVILWSIPCAPGSGEARAGPETRTILLVDDHDVLYRSGTVRVLRPLDRAVENPVIAADKPWETLIGYCSVYREPGTGHYQLTGIKRNRRPTCAKPPPETGSAGPSQTWAWSSSRAASTTTS